MPIIYLLGGLVVMAMLAPLITALIRGGFPKDRDHRVQTAFEETAEELGLEFKLVPTGLSARLVFEPERKIYIPTHEPTINGQWRGRQIKGHGKVELLRNSGSEFRHRPKISVEILDERLKKVRIEPRHKVGRLEKMAVGQMADVDWGQPDTPTGDDRFDAEFIVGGMIDDDVMDVLRVEAVKDELRALDRDPEILWFEIRLGLLTVEIDFRGLDSETLRATIEESAERARKLEQAGAGRGSHRQSSEEYFPTI